MCKFKKVTSIYNYYSVLCGTGGLPCREAARASKAEEVRQQRIRRAGLLRQQQAAMSALQARRQADITARLRSALLLTAPWSCHCVLLRPGLAQRM